MKKNITIIGIFVVLIFSLILFAGCSEKKSVVKSDETKIQETVPAPAPAAPSTPETVTQESVAPPEETTKTKDTSNEQSSLMEGTTKSPVSDINFDFDSYSIRPDAREILKANADYLLKHKVSSIVVEGHCDERGTAEYNMALGERRAQETKKFLVNLGINDSIIKTISYGEERPLDHDNTEEAWATNRRAHFVVNP